MSSQISSASSGLWQHPYVDIFKHFKVAPGGDWRQNKKQGDVQEIFVIKTSFFYPLNLHLGKGDRPQSPQYPGKYLGQQLRAGA